MEILIFYGLLLGVGCFNIRIAKDQNHVPFDKTSSVCLKGICCILIILHHLYQRTLTGMPAAITKMNTYLGGVVVGLFFMLSAIGLVKSYQNKGESYLKKMITKNVPMIYLSYVVVNVIIFFAFEFGKMGWLEAILKILGFEIFYGFSRVNSDAWFIPVIILVYILFFTVYKLFGKNKNHAVWVLTAIIILYNIIVNGISFFPNLYARGILCFPLGALYATYFDNVNNFVKKYFYESAIISVFIIIISFVFNVEVIAAVGTCLFVITVLQKITFSNAITNFLGGISLYVYLWQAMAIKCSKMIFSNRILIMLFAIVLSVVIAYVYSLLRKCFWGCVKSINSRKND